MYANGVSRVAWAWAPRQAAESLSSVQRGPPYLGRESPLRWDEEVMLLVTSTVINVEPISDMVVLRDPWGLADHLSLVTSNEIGRGHQT